MPPATVNGHPTGKEPRTRDVSFYRPRLSLRARARLVMLAGLNEPPSNPRAWLFRVASNQWINRVKRRREVLVEPPEPSSEPDLRGAREAAGSLVARLAPRERAALVLEEAFEFSLSEIAETLSTTPGAVKAALHRGRGKLEDPVAASAPPPVLDAFCAAFNARDIDAVKRSCSPGGNTKAARRCMASRSSTSRASVWPRMRTYFHSPEAIAELCSELALPYQTSGYRFW
jgi:hypothetical protein